MKSKYLFLALVLMLVVCASCTRQSRNRTFGGTMKIDLPPGQELMEATWKENNLFYLTRPMSDDYEPMEKTFQESSSFGILQSKVIFIEHKN